MTYLIPLSLVLQFYSRLNVFILVVDVANLIKLSASGVFFCYICQQLFFLSRVRQRGAF